ncbi:annulin-like isoform X2 [Ostrinia furnacalis]|uniref:annulin-like isoform X2 n=1 Tax=Ostrinia furnacalis TaxID=93504 RepID=UPI001040A1CE|nr:annulin-like isoform X2 [Ostrinia furnacalis]
MGSVGSKLASYTRPLCCKGCKSDSYDLKDLPRPPRLDTSNDVIDGTRLGVLAVQGIDFCIDSNGENHHTHKFHLMTRPVDRCLVVRRGQAFKLDLLLNRPFDANRDAVSFIFYVPDSAMRGPSNEMSAPVPLLEKGSEVVGGWSAVYEGQMDSHLMVAITPASDCIVSAWRMDIDTKLTSGGSLSYTHPLPIYVLFNPWSLNDSVYMPGHSHREEYVQEDGGLMFRGVYNVIKPTPWNYAQYEKDILECALYLVSEIGKVKGRARGDPIRVARALSAAVNVQDDNGVLFGNWGKELSDYSGGTHPLKWIGSLTILQKYYEKKKPVKYAQCWVYAGVLTTICRALGIPCRPVTGFDAAHDSGGSLTIDIIQDEDGNIMENFTNDSVWNYHVWNEVWMERPDLGSEYGGWQAIDATPQEMSEDMFRCGPASLRAVRDADIQRPYDAGYVFAQVNADKLLWLYTGEIQPLKLLGRDTRSIGQNLSTKAIGRMEREDITNLYKYPESSREERSAMEKALRRNGTLFARYYLNDDFNDVTFDFELRDDIKIGQEFSVVLHMKNRSTIQEHRVKGILRVDTVTYRGKTGDNVKRHEFDMVLAPAAKQRVDMLVTFDDYYKRLVDQASFNIATIATIVEKEFDYFAQDDFRVRNPDIKITLDGKPVSKKELTVTVKLENPLPIPLKNGKFYIQGPGLDKQVKIELDETIAPGAIASAQFKLTPPWAGRHQISAKFNSKEMHDVDGFLTFKVAMPVETNGFSSDNNGYASENNIETHQV